MLYTCVVNEACGIIFAMHKIHVWMVLWLPFLSASAFKFLCGFCFCFFFLCYVELFSWSSRVLLPIFWGVNFIYYTFFFKCLSMNTHSRFALSFLWFKRTVDDTTKYKIKFSFEICWLITRTWRLKLLLGVIIIITIIYSSSTFVQMVNNRVRSVFELRATATYYHWNLFYIHPLDGMLMLTTLQLISLSALVKCCWWCCCCCRCCRRTHTIRIQRSGFAPPNEHKTPEL